MACSPGIYLAPSATVDPEVRVRTRFLPLLGFAWACEPNDPETISETTPDTTPDDGGCVSAEVGTEGVVLSIAGGVLDIPAGATSTKVVELCWRATVEPDIVGGVWTLGPRSLVLNAPARFVGSVEPGPSGRLFVPGSDGQPRPAFAADPTVGEVYRPGEIFVATDERSQVLYAPVVPPLDVLYVVDDTFSMAAEQALLIQEFPDVLDRLLAAGIDFHVGVVTTDMEDRQRSGILRSVGGARWVDDTTPDPGSVFRSLADVGTTGSSTEQGLDAAYTALEVLADGANDGFLRDEASIHVVVVSDEPDFSDQVDPDSYVKWFEGFTSDRRSAATHAIACENADGDCFAVSTDYLDVAARTSGSRVHIQEYDWSPVYDDLIDRNTVGWSEVPSTIEAESLEAWWLGGGEPQRFAEEDVTFHAPTHSVSVDAGRKGTNDVVLIFEDAE